MVDNCVDQVFLQRSDYDEDGDTLGSLSNWATLSVRSVSERDLSCEASFSKVC